MRINELKPILGKKRSDAAVFYNSDSSKINANMLYFSGYKGLGALVIPKKHAPFLIVPEMEMQRAKKSMVKKVYSMNKKRFFESIYKIARKNRLNTKNIAIDKSSFTLNSYRHFRNQFKKIKSKDIAFECLKLRETKTEKEIRILKKSCAYADKILQKAIKNFRHFKTESQAAAFLEYEAKKLGLELSFSPIVASGSNGSMPHHEPSNVKIKNDFCVIDFGVKYKGYCSDITRTIYVGKPSEKEKEMYNMLLKIQENAIIQIKSGKKCSEIYDFVVKSLGKYRNYFTHGLGHGVGIEIHELPNLSLSSKDRIKNNMVFTIEPGIYFPKRFGIRIEDTLLFKNKPVLLTKTSKDLLII
ncbi:aminopeptidase P family protein [Candidatus Woesearchaeota archaeon]|nr:aminopeptidase P family protein [Candidatus Woesearchaeota archaeon]